MDNPHRVWLDRPVFVTGASGLAGGWLVARLAALGASVVCLVRDWRPQSALLRTRPSNVTFVFGDLRDHSLVERALGEYEIQVAFHLAAQTIVPIANRNPVETFDSNIRGTWTVLEACRRSPTVHAIIVASSDKAYGAQVDLPYREDAPLTPTFPYDVSKACADLIARSYAETFALPVVVTRAGNFFGGGDLNWSRLIPGTIRALLRGDRPIIRSDGSPRRDYLYIEDAVEAYLLLAEALLTTNLCKSPLNIGYGQPRSVFEVVKLITECLGCDCNPIIENQATGEIHDQYLDSTTLTDSLGWKPQYGFVEGLRRTVDWYKINLPEFFDV